MYKKKEKKSTCDNMLINNNVNSTGNNGHLPACRDDAYICDNNAKAVE